jgi:hypothetical protein
MNERAEISGKLYYMVERLKQPMSDDVVIICTDAEGIR